MPQDLHSAFSSALLVTMLTAAASGCDKKEDSGPPIPAPPPPGAASVEMLTTGLGVARGIDASLAASSTVWKRAWVIDERRAVLVGEIAQETVALVTPDGGRSWRSFKAERGDVAAWSVGPEGVAALLSGKRGEATTAGAAKTGPLDGATVAFAEKDGRTLSAPLGFGLPEGASAQLTTGTIPAVLGANRAALVADDGKRRPIIVFAEAGAEDPKPVALPAGERPVPVPYGRPPLLVTLRGRDVLSRPFPEPGQPLAAASKLAGVFAAPTTLAELSAPPSCEWGATSWQRLTQPGGRAILLAIGGAAAGVVPLAPGALNEGSLGCALGRVTVLARDAKAKSKTVVVCDRERGCVTPPKPPFRAPLEGDEELIVSTPTEQGAVAVRQIRARGRWELQVAHSLEESSLYEVARVAGEGTGDRGRLELGALLSFGKRTLLLVAADVTGTNRRGWYVSVSDDGGATWGPP